MTVSRFPFQHAKAPHVRTPRLDPTALPVGRLRRLGFTDNELGAAAERWVGRTDDDKKNIVARLAVLTDSQAARESRGLLGMAARRGRPRKTAS